MNDLDVLCIGHASFDLVFSVSRHPAADEKTFADSMISCGGGPAANAAVCVARLGLKAAFCGYLGNDVYAEKHLQEFQAEQVNSSFVVRGEYPTPLSVVLAKPDGKRSLVNYKAETKALPADSVDLIDCQPKVVLFDGHEPDISLSFLKHNPKALSILDGGSVHHGSLALIDKVEYLVCSEKFAMQYAGDENLALSKMAELAPIVVITLGERGLIWKRGLENGKMTVPPVSPVDSTGAGDAFHGALAAALALKYDWLDALRFASAAGAYCCTQLGARPGLPNRLQIQNILNNWR